MPIKRRPAVFLSYSRDDQKLAVALERALKRRKIHVWRDCQGITAGTRWFDEIQTALRASRGLVVLVTPASETSDWVTYEYAFATGARVPVVAVSTRDARVPRPIQQFQIIPYSSARSIARRIDEGFSRQSRSTGQERVKSPALLAKFQEVNGKVAVASRGRTPALCMDLWLEQVPAQTTKVYFEIPDEGFRDRKWTRIRKSKVSADAREFLTDDMNSYGDVELWARGIGPGAGSWTGSWRLYEALVRHYRGRPQGPRIRAALQQIRDN